MFPPEEAGGFLPARHPEKSAPHDSKRAVQDPGPRNPLALMPCLFLGPEVLPSFHFLDYVPDKISRNPPVDERHAKPLEEHEIHLFTGFLLVHL